MMVMMVMTKTKSRLISSLRALPFCDLLVHNQAHTKLQHIAITLK